jgi:hypothetical protein
MSPERQQFVERLVEIVTHLKYPEHGRQTALAKRYKLKQPSVRKWFTGDAMPSYEIAVDLCKRAMVSYEWLMSGRGNKFLNHAEHLDPQILEAIHRMQNMTPHQVRQTIKLMDFVTEPEDHNAES